MSRFRREDTSLICQTANAWPPQGSIVSYASDVTKVDKIEVQRQQRGPYLEEEWFQVQSNPYYLPLACLRCSSPLFSSHDNASKQH